MLFSYLYLLTVIDNRADNETDHTKQKFIH